MRIFQEKKRYVHIEKEGRIEIYTNKCTNERVDIRVDEQTPGTFGYSI